MNSVSFPALWPHDLQNFTKFGSWIALLSSRLEHQISLQVELLDEVEAHLCNSVKQTSLLLPLRYLWLNTISHAGKSNAFFRNANFCYSMASSLGITLEKILDGE